MIERFENLEEKLFLGILANGEKVFDKPESHLHGNVRDFVIANLHLIGGSEGEEFIEKYFTLEEKLPHFLVEVDPQKDDLFFAQRKGREGLSLFVRNRIPGQTDKITVILRQSSAYPEEVTPIEDGYTLATAYLGEGSPRESWDNWFEEGNTQQEREKRLKMKEEATKFWAKHAFIPDEEEFPLATGQEFPFKKN